MADRLAYRLRSLLAALSERVIVAFKPFGLRHGSFTTMALISANPGCSQIDLAREGDLDKTSVMFILNDLEAKGLAIRGRMPADKRRSALYLTPQGEQVMREMYQAAMKTEAVLHERIAGEELRALFSMLERAYDIVAAHAEDTRENDLMRRDR
jgi:DNA-binding MarR family transcriptional regulator